MATWEVELPEEAVEGAETHVEDHNVVYAALREVRENIDTIELTPGEDGKDGDDGKDATPQFTEEQVTALLALIEDDA